MTNQNSRVTKLVLDVLKPHEPSIIEFASKLTSINGIRDINVTSLEIDQSTETIKIQVAGDDINIEEVKREIEELGAVIHSVDEVTVMRRNI